MTDKSKPQQIAEEDLDAAQGGFIAFGEETGHVKTKQRNGTLSARDGADRFIGETEKSIITAGAGDGSI